MKSFNTGIECTLNKPLFCPDNGETLKTSNLNMKIGITGGCGFVGSNLAEHFATRANKVFVLDNLMRQESYFNLQRLKENENIEYIRADIRNPKDLNILYKCDAIFDCAAQTAVPHGEQEPAFNFTNNTVGILNILEIVRKTKVPLIYWASNKVYPSDGINSLPVFQTEKRYEWNKDLINKREYLGLSFTKIFEGEKSIIGINENWPLGLGGRSIYGASKASSDIWCQEYRDAFNIPIFINRFSCIAGPWQYGMAAQGWYVWFIIAAKKGLHITFYGWNGKQVRDVLFISDVCKLIEKQLTMGFNRKSFGGVYNIGGGIQNSLSLLEHVDMLKSAGLNPIIRCENGPKRRRDQVIYISDTTKAKKEFNWFPEVSLEAGFEECLNWVNDNDYELTSIYGRRNYG